MFGLLGLAASSAPTHLDMLRTMLAYPTLAWGMFEVSVWREGEDGVIRFERSAATGDCTDFFMERDMTCTTVLSRDAAGSEETPRLVQFRHAGPRRKSAYERFFGCEVRFAAGIDEIRLDAANWLSPPRLANAMSFRFFDNQCRRLSEVLARPLDFVDLVRSRLRAATPVPSLPELAASLHLTARTLQRRLAEQDTTFAALLRDVRLERAGEMLRRGGLPMEEIAWRLGFGDAVAFSHAFKQWTGLSPARFREANA